MPASCDADPDTSARPRLQPLRVNPHHTSSLCPIRPCAGVLKEVLVEEGVWRRNGELPTEAEPPHLKIKSLKVLGTPTCDCVELEKNAKLGAEKLGAEKLREAALAERQRRVEAGIDDDVQEEMTAKPAMTNAALQAKRLEICWGLYYDEQGAREKNRRCGVRAQFYASRMAPLTRARMGRRRVRVPAQSCRRVRFSSSGIPTRIAMSMRPLSCG